MSKHLFSKQINARRARLVACEDGTEEARRELYEAICESHPELTYAEIAELTGLSYGRVRQIVAKGKKDRKTVA